ncbi:MAG: hypothetical protein QNL07_05360 [Candidatus Planktophila sp.]
MQRQVLLSRLWEESRAYFYSDRALIKIFSRLLFSSLLATLLIVVSNAIADEIAAPTNSEETTIQVEENVQPTPETTIQVEENVQPTPEPSIQVEENVQPTPEPTIQVEENVQPTPEPSIQVEENVQPTPEPCIQPTMEPTITPYVSPTPSSLPSSSSAPCASPELKIAYLPDVQPPMRILMPTSIGVDPRARSSFLPRVDFFGSNFVIACFYGNGIMFDAGNLHVTDDRQVPERKYSQPAKFDTFEVLGDRTSTLLVAGKENQVRNFLNSGNGLFAFTSGSGISGRSISLFLTGLVEPKLKLEFCEAAKSSANSVFRTIGIEINTKSGSGKLK